MDSYLSNLSRIHDGVNDTVRNPDQEKNDIYPQNVMATVYVTITLIMSIVGIVGNTFVLGALLVHRKLRVLGNCFIGNLAVADLFICTIIDPFVAVGVFTNGTFFYKYNICCEIVASVCMVTCICSLWSICLLSINRYLCICHNKIYAMIYTQKTVPLMLLGLWTYCFLLDLPNFIGWGNHGYDSKGYMCSYDYREDYSYTLCLIFAGIMVPMVLVTYCYVQIIRFVNENKRKLKLNMRKQNPLSARRMRRTDFRLLKSVATIWFVFTLTWFPYGVLMLLSNPNIPQWLYLVSIILAHSNSSLNCLIYAATNKTFRTAYKTAWYRAICCVISEKKARSKGACITTVSENSGWTHGNKSSPRLSDCGSKSITHDRSMALLDFSR